MVKKDQQLYLIIIALAVVLVGGGGYWLYKQSHKSATVSSATSTDPTQTQGGPPAGGFRGGSGGGRSGGANFARVSGTLTAKTATTLTINTSNGTQTVTFDSLTRFNKSDGTTMSTITLTEVNIGDTVTAMGAKDSSGNITTAQMVFDGVMPTRPQGGQGQTPPSGSNYNGSDNNSGNAI